MTNRKNIFFGSFAVIFFLSAALMTFLQFKDQHQIDFISIVVLSAVLAFIGSAIGAGVLPTIPQFEATTPKLPLTALRISVIAGLLAFIGGGLAFSGFLSVGRILAATGIIVGNIMIFSILVGKVFGLFNNK